MWAVRADVGIERIQEQLPGTEVGCSRGVVDMLKLLMMGRSAGLVKQLSRDGRWRETGPGASSVASTSGPALPGEGHYRGTGVRGYGGAEPIMSGSHGAQVAPANQTG